MILSVIVFLTYLGEVMCCSVPLEEMAQRFDLVLIGLEKNHFTRAGGEVDSEFEVSCVLKGDGGIVYETVRIRATQTKYPCTKDTSPTRIGKSYIIGVSRLNDSNFTWSSEGEQETVAFPASTDNIKTLIQYCEFQNPKAPFGESLFESRTPCPYVTQDDRQDCRNSSEIVQTNMFLIATYILLYFFLLFKSNE